MNKLLTGIIIGAVFYVVIYLVVVYGFGVTFTVSGTMGLGLLCGVGGMITALETVYKDRY